MIFLLLFSMAAVVFTTTYSSYRITFLNSFPQHRKPGARKQMDVGKAYIEVLTTFTSLM